jgi:hypothetical protein
MDHEIVKCSCGRVLAQCRCFAKDKPVRIVENGCVDCCVRALDTMQCKPAAEGAD